MFVVNVLHMPSQIATLSEGLFAPRTLEASLDSVLSEMISQVAALFKNTVAPFELAFEVQFEPLSLLVLDLDGLMPVIWNAWEDF